MSVRIRLAPAEIDLMIAALDEWSWSIRDRDERGTPNNFYNGGQQQACRFTMRRVQELRARLVDAGAAALVKAE